MNNLAPMKNCPGGVQGNLNWMPGYISQSCMLITFATSLDPVQAQQNWIQTVRHSDGVSERIFREKK